MARMVRSVAGPNSLGRVARILQARCRTTRLSLDSAFERWWSEVGQEARNDVEPAASAPVGEFGDLSAERPNIRPPNDDDVSRGLNGGGDGASAARSVAPSANIGPDTAEASPKSANIGPDTAEASLARYRENHWAPAKAAKREDLKARDRARSYLTGGDARLCPR